MLGIHTYSISSSLLTEFNFSANHKSFTVARIFDPNERISGPVFAPHVSQYKLSTFYLLYTTNYLQFLLFLNRMGVNCASCKFYIGDSSVRDSPLDDGCEPEDPAAVEETVPNTWGEGFHKWGSWWVSQVSLEGNPSKKMHRFMNLALMRN